MDQDIDPFDQSHSPEDVLMLCETRLSHTPTPVNDLFVHL